MCLEPVARLFGWPGTFSFPSWAVTRNSSCGLCGGGRGCGLGPSVPWNWHLSPGLWSALFALSPQPRVPLQTPNRPSKPVLETTNYTGRWATVDLAAPAALGWGDRQVSLPSPGSAEPRWDQAYQENAAPDTDTGIASPPPTLRRGLQWQPLAWPTSAQIWVHMTRRRRDSERANTVDHPSDPCPGLLTCTPTAGNSAEVTAAPDHGQASPETVPVCKGVI